MSQTIITLTAKPILTLEEEYLMTFQLALIGSDGLIVASDRRMQYRSKPEGKIDAGLFQPVAGSKFTQSPNGDVICASAGSAIATQIAIDIAMKCDPSLHSDSTSWRYTVNLVAEETLATSSPHLEEIIVVRKDMPECVLLVSAQTCASTTVISEFICTGFSTPARFLPRHLWKRSSVASLKSLAILTLGYAEKENPSGIGDGFEIMILHADSTISRSEYRPRDERIAKLMEEFSDTISLDKLLALSIKLST